ncbi:MAG: hypothetical protein AAGI68_07225 [Planctomycetota bacterium]
MLDSPFAASAAVLAGLLLIIAAIVAAERHARRVRQRQRDDLLALLDDPDIEAVTGQDNLADASSRVQVILKLMAFYARQIHLPAVLRLTNQPFAVEITHAVIGMERSNANHQTLDKLVVVCHAFPEDTPPLPDFQLLPSHPIFRSVYRQPVFDHSSPFGKRNLVLGTEHRAVQDRLHREARALLADNRDLCITAEQGLLAFYLHAETVQPRDLPAHLTRCLTLAHTLLEPPNRDPRATP